MTNSSTPSVRHYGRITLSVALLSLLTLAACQKGDTGPTGPKGTANVVYSNWHYLTSAWRDTTLDGSLLKYNVDSTAFLTQHVIDTAAVLVYINWGSGPFPLPYTSFAGGKASTMSYLVGLNRFTYTRFTHDNTASVAVSMGILYRWIIIPGGTKTLAKSAAGGDAPQVDVAALRQMDYAEVCRTLGIPE